MEDPLEELASRTNKRILLIEVDDSTGEWLIPEGQLFHPWEIRGLLLDICDDFERRSADDEGVS